MQNSLASIERISFHTDSLFCPVIENEPYVIMNTVIKNIGLNYKAAIEDLSNSRFSKWISTLKLSNQSDKVGFTFCIKLPKTSPSNGGLNPQNLNTYFTLSTNQSIQIEELYSEIGGYEYFVLPLRKFFGWMNSINLNKVKPEIRNKLEMYQDECDEILFNHFFGIVSERKRTLIEKAEISTLLNELEKDLRLNSPLFIQYESLKAQEMRLGKKLKELDRNVVDSQKKLSF